ncbi:universal stress protein UspA-like protein [Desulfosporosinus acidiphilus SJ4]|uniref:Universal stress protein UspA-like protein n=1 Tax=Desulfosporosinus acidiphilus (strain DSM 22704 / JCM 16185 / SJ4) TaxID=646529 RepID=I4D9L2_DESAJ|nr:universal stress protein [Desulfosporosinus acidiphilus]AFM42486.1 universal stress protein UspA-like protein [Desulfosporosinus acidiphilus SJ4]
MNHSLYKVLLYIDGSNQSFSAAVYTAILFKEISNIHLTIIQIEECIGGSMGIEYSWRELRPKYKKCYWGCSKEKEYCWRDIWPVRPNPDWMKLVLSEANMETRNKYDRILAKTDEIFSRRGLNPNHQTLYANISVSDKSDIANMIIDYATKNSFQLLIMGTRGLPTIQGLVSGSLAQMVRSKSTIPVLLVKKLPQEFIDSYLSDTEPLISNKDQLVKQC